MGVLRAAEAGRVFALPARSLIGRSRACDLILAEPNVSGQHAAIEWQDDRWVLLDLGSRNGTYLGDARIPVGARLPLARGAALRFGRDAPRWELVDDDPPELLACEVATGEQRRADGGCLVLPGPEAPERAVYQDPRGAWVVEEAGECAPLDDRALLTLDSGAVWRVHLPLAGGATQQDRAAPPLVAALRLRFAHSRDEEYVELVAETDSGERLDLQARAHHYPLLLLARRRLADRAAGLAAADEGWIRQDELLRMLRIDASHLNISVHRARAQLGQLGVADAAALVERRPGTRQLRLGPADVEIVELAAPPR